MAAVSYLILLNSLLLLVSDLHIHMFSGSASGGLHHQPDGFGDFAVFADDLAHVSRCLAPFP